MLRLPSMVPQLAALVALAALAAAQGGADLGGAQIVPPGPDDGPDTFEPPNPPTPLPKVSPTPQVYAGGNYQDLCTLVPSEASDRVAASCRRDLVCVQFTPDDNLVGNCPPQPDQGCYCGTRRQQSPPDECKTSADCREGDRCVTGGNTIDTAAKECFGCATAAELGYKPVDDDATCKRLASAPAKTSPVTTAPPATSPVTVATTAAPPASSPDAVAVPGPIGVSTAPTPNAGDADGAPSVSPDVDVVPGPAVPTVSDAPTPVAVPMTEPTLTPSVSASPSASPSPSLGSTVDGEDGEDAPAPSPSPSPVNDPVCIGAHHLARHAASDLVFAAHRPARVLCDARGSCATPGHVVEFGGRAMAMRTYCAAHARGGCAGRVMAVNSPRWAAGRRVDSLTEGLRFTALAARWETMAEERVLAALVRLGA